MKGQVMCLRNKIYQVSMEVAGPTALWSRPDCGDSTSSYAAPTFSAARALFESVLWGPAIRIIPRKVELCSVPAYHAYTTNYGGPLRSSTSMKGGNNYQMFATVLEDVCYRLYADVIPNPDKNAFPEKALSWDRKTTSPGHAYQEIFNRRLQRGQSYATLFLGWSEFTVSYFGPFREQTKVCTDLPDIYIPSMLREVFPDGYKSQYRAIYDNDLCIHRGVLVYPERSSEV
jgi:CRISPR-associated protein Cas5d